VLRTSGGSTQVPLSPQISRRPGTRELGRNDPCWCGSGKKYKNCHFQEDQQKGLKRYVSQKPASEHAHAASSK